MTLLRTHGPWALAVALALLWAFSERSGRLGAEARLEVERSLTESRQTLDAAVSRARAVADAQRVAIEAARGVVEAVARVEETEAAREVGQAEADEAAIADEYRRTGRVVEAARRSWERWRQMAPAQK